MRADNVPGRARGLLPGGKLGPILTFDFFFKGRYFFTAFFNIAGNKRNKVCTKQECLLRQEKDPKEVAARILAIGLI